MAHRAAGVTSTVVTKVRLVQLSGAGSLGAPYRQEQEALCSSSLLKEGEEITPAALCLRPMFPLHVSSLSLSSLPAFLCFHSTSSNFLSTTEKMEGASGIPLSLFSGSFFAHKPSSNPAALGAVSL